MEKGVMMDSCVKFLTDLGFEEAIENHHHFCIEDIEQLDIEDFEDIYRKNIVAMKDEFDDCFIVDMLLSYTTVLIRSDFCEMLEQVKKAFGTDMWETLVQYEWNKTGKSSIFELMDSLEIGEFESQLASVCKATRSVWVNDYGDSDL